MILRLVCCFSIVTALMMPAAAQERVTVGTLRAISSGALFVAAAQGYFKAEGLDVEMTAYASEQAVAEALAADATDFGLAAFTPTAFNLAGQGMIKAIAAQVREKHDYEGNAIVVSNGAYASGLRRVDELAGATFAISQFGSAYHYQLGQTARAKRFDLAGITLKAQQSLDATARAVGSGQVDAAILPVQYVRELLVTNQARLIGWYSEVDEQQLGALFASRKMLETRRATVEKFLSAYRHGAADYASALLRRDRQTKRISDAQSQAVAATIARYVYPSLPLATAAATVEAGAYFMEPQARLDLADVARQVEWYKAQGLIDASVDARTIVDSSLVK